MEDYKELYILGQPIKTNIGKARFILVKEYPILTQYIPFLELEKFEVVKFISELDKELGEFIKDMSFIEIIQGMKDVIELYNKFQELFLLVFKEDVFEKIETDEEFEYYRNLIQKMNGIQYEKKNPNPRIQYFNELKKLYDKRKSNGGLTFEALYTSVEVETGKDVDNMTIYKLYALFNRISQFKNYDSTSLFATVSSEVKIEQWYKHVDLFGEEKRTSLEEFSKQAKQLVE